MNNLLNNKYWFLYGLMLLNLMFFVTFYVIFHDVASQFLINILWLWLMKQWWQQSDSHWKLIKGYQQLTKELLEKINNG